MDEDLAVATGAGDLRGRAVPTPWQGHFVRYENHGGMKVPMAGEVEWLLPDGPQKYWRGEITGIAFEFWAGDVAFDGRPLLTRA